MVKLFVSLSQPLTEERRKELVKNVKKIGEDAKVSIRNIRRDINDQLKKMKKMVTLLKMI